MEEQSRDRGRRWTLDGWLDSTRGVLFGYRLDGAVEEWATPDILVVLAHVLLCLAEIGKSLV